MAQFLFIDVVTVNIRIPISALPSSNFPSASPAAPWQEAGPIDPSLAVDLEI